MGLYFLYPKICFADFGILSMTNEITTEKELIRTSLLSVIGMNKNLIMKIEIWKEKKDIWMSCLRP